MPTTHDIAARRLRYDEAATRRAAAREALTESINELTALVDQLDEMTGERDYGTAITFADQIATVGRELTARGHRVAFALRDMQDLA